MAKGFKLKTQKEIDLIRESCVLASDILQKACEMVKPGVTTLQIDDFVREYTESMGAKSAPLGYHGFPNSCCISVNHVVCHGVPSSYVLKDGDILNIDVTPILNGYHGDCSRTVCVGQSSDTAKKLVDATLEGLLYGIDSIQIGKPLGQIGRAIQEIADSNGFTLVQQLGGHGIGRVFHEEPFVPCFWTPDVFPLVEEGMVFTIEPMMCEGTSQIVKLKDGHSWSTADMKLSAQFEHTVAITENGVEVLTHF